MRLVHKPEDILPVFHGLPFAFLAVSGIVCTHAFCDPYRKLLVCPHAPTHPAIVSHSSSSFSDQSADHKPNSMVKRARCAVIVSFGGFAQTQVARSFERP